MERAKVYNDAIIIQERMQSGTLHIASLLFSIFHKASFMRKYVDQIWFPRTRSFVKD